MFYLEYENDTHLVVEIHPEKPDTVRNNCTIATSDNYPPGLELEYVITVDTVDQEGMVTASSTTKQAAPAYQLFNRIIELESENTALKQQINDLNLAIAAIMGGAV